MLNLLDGWFKFDIGDGAFYSVFGFLFVFIGISLLIVIFTLVGLAMKKANARKRTKKESDTPVLQIEEEEGVTPEVVAAITAALMAYYEQENVKCDFVVRRIKKI